VEQHRKAFALEITARPAESEFYIVENFERTHIAPFLGTPLNPQFVNREGSPWDGASGGLDYLVNAEYFHGLVEEYTGLGRPPQKPKIGNMIMSRDGLIMLRNFEMTETYARSHGLAELDAQNNWIGIYPHYVFRSRDGRWESDGGITVGFGSWISQGVYSQQEWARNIIDTYAPNASFTPPYVPANGTPRRVPGSMAMSLENATRLLEENRVPQFTKYVNDFLIQHEIPLQQHEFDVLVSFTFNFGQNVWTQIDETTGDLFWNVARFIRNSSPFDPDEAWNVFTVGYVNPELQGRREREANIFINGHQ
jgi:GH24 family phage-related lysozyme (muramidase)